MAVSLVVSGRSNAEVNSPEVKQVHLRRNLIRARSYIDEAHQSLDRTNVLILRLNKAVDQLCQLRLSLTV